MAPNIGCHMAGEESILHLKNENVSPGSDPSSGPGPGPGENCQLSYIYPKHPLGVPMPPYAAAAAAAAAAEAAAAAAALK